MKLITLALGMVAIAVAGVVAGQTPVQKPTFEAASIKRNTSNPRNSPMVAQPGGRFTATNATLKALITYAYGLYNFQLYGGPEWLSSEHWDIVATSEVGTAASGVKVRLQSLLEDRFQLKTHGEIKELPVYDLVVAKGGSRMKLSDDQNPPGPADNRGGLLFGPNRLEATSTALTFLLGPLSALLGRQVIDKTNLSGLYDIKLQWAPDVNQSTGVFGGVNTAVPDGNAPSMFTAVQEQLGLRLEASRAATDVLVIDSIEHPTEN
jgi:uncharacterized protein (TIGR03435 family)